MDSHMMEEGKREDLKPSEPLTFLYEEWMLTPESLHPGWEYVQNFAEAVFGKQESGKAWIFEKNRKEKYYAHISTFEPNMRASFLKALKNCMKRDAICLLQIFQDTPVHQLFHHYEKVSEGLLYDNQQSPVFPAPIEVGEWFILGEREMLLVIHHDGECLCLLKQPDKSGN